MNESEFLTSFRGKLKRRNPFVFWYKIPDTAGMGGKRPFDVICGAGKQWFAIEAKIDPNEKPTKWQQHNLDLAERNGAVQILLNPANAAQVLRTIEEAYQDGR